MQNSAVDRNMPGVNMKEATKAGAAKGEEEKARGHHSGWEVVPIM